MPIKKPTQPRNITLMVIPHNSAKDILKLKVPEWLMRVILIAAGIIVAMIVLFFLYSTRLTLKMIHYHGLLLENKRQQTQIEYFLKETEKLKKGVQDLEAKDQELREMLGIKGKTQERPKVKPTSGGQTRYIDDRIKNNLAWIARTIKQKTDEYVALLGIVENTRYRFSHLPSLWPVYGAIKSGFAWRMHPFLGKMEHHDGVDIPIWQGCPVRSAADGLVIFAGWSKGYGITVVVDHGNKYRSIYAHNSRLLCRMGDNVYKGQPISEAGSTGWSTGTHVHYEIRYANKPIAPNQYLDLNIHTASNFIR